MSGIQDLPHQRIPEQWDARWFLEFIRDVLAKADVRNAIGEGGVSISGGPDEEATLALDDVPIANFEDIATNTFLGRQSVGTGDVESLTATETTALLDVATVAEKGLVLRAAAVSDASASTVSIGAADANDLATVITLANEIKSDLTQIISDLNATITQLNAKLSADFDAGQML